MIGCVSIGFDSELGIWIEIFEHLLLHHNWGFDESIGIPALLGKECELLFQCVKGW